MMLEILNAFPWYAWIAIIAIGGGLIRSFVAGLMHHRERMAMIKAGMHPDSRGSSGVCDRDYSPNQ